MGGKRVSCATRGACSPESRYVSELLPDPTTSLERRLVGWRRSLPQSETGLIQDRALPDRPAHERDLAVRSKE